MKITSKTGKLAILLVLPVLLLIFLYQFGNNKFNIPIYFAYDSTLIDGKYVITDAHHIPDFNFITQEGNYLKGRDLKGSVYIANFFFSRCPGICKDMSQQLTRVQAQFQEDDSVKIISFTVDPEFDHPDVLKKYASIYRAIPGKWYFLTGNKDSLYALAKTGFFISALEDKNSPEEFIHSEKLILVDKEGRIRGYYDGTSKKEVDKLITETAILLNDYENK